MLVIAACFVGIYPKVCAAPIVTSVNPCAAEGENKGVNVSLGSFEVKIENLELKYRKVETSVTELGN